MNLQSRMFSVNTEFTLRSHIIKDYLWLIFGAIFSFIIATLIVYGDFYTATSFFASPLLYAGDGLFGLWYAERINEGWVLNNIRNGYPFGSDISSYPNSDSGNFIVIKLLSFFLDGSEKILNIFFLLGFSISFISAFIVLRLFKLSLVLSFCGAIIFAFAPYHFYRLGHIFLSFYFVVPIYIYLAFKCFSCENDISKEKNTTSYLMNGLFLIFIASFGLYYAFFGCLIIFVSGIAAAIKNGNIKFLSKPILYILFISIGVLINISPSIYQKMTAENTPSVVVRGPSEAEIYGLKIHQLIAPTQGHRIPLLAKYNRLYNSSSPLSNENASSSLGIIGSLGFVLTLLFSFSVLARKKTVTDDRTYFIAFSIIVILLFSTIGGFSSVFSYLVSPSIRGWNRISIFISFLSVTFLCLFIQTLITKSNKTNSIPLLLGCFVVTLLSVLDQTTLSSKQNFINVNSTFNDDNKFIAQIEQSLSPQSAIYQLPYMAFPEVPPIHNLNDYDLAVGFIQSKSLKWSYATMKGSQGDLFFRFLAKEPIQDQINIIKRLGFSGIYLDLRGYKDNGKLIQNELTQILGKPTITHPRGHVLFYPITGDTIQFDGTQSAFQIMEKAQFIIDKNGKRYDAKLTDLIEFNKQGIPSFLRTIKGLSQVESWGRWSESSNVKFEFIESLPSEFSVIFSGISFDPNTGEILKITVGDTTKTISLNQGNSEYRLHFEDIPLNVHNMIFTIPHPISPFELGVSSDKRKLGFGFKTLKIDI